MADEDHDERELDDDPDVVAGHREVVAAAGRDLLGELEKGPHAREAEKAHADRLDHLDRDVGGRRVHLGEIGPLAGEVELEQPRRRDALQHRLAAVDAEARDALGGAVDEIGDPGPCVYDIEARILPAGAHHEVVVGPHGVRGDAGVFLAVLDRLVVVVLVFRLEALLGGLHGQRRRWAGQCGQGRRGERERQHGRERGAQGGRGPRRAPIFSR